MISWPTARPTSVNRSRRRPDRRSDGVELLAGILAGPLLDGGGILFPLPRCFAGRQTPTTTAQDALLLDAPHALRVGDVLSRAELS